MASRKSMNKSRQLQSGVVTKDISKIINTLADVTIKVLPFIIDTISGGGKPKQAGRGPVSPNVIKATVKRTPRKSVSRKPRKPVTRKRV